MSGLSDSPPWKGEVVILSGGRFGEEMEALKPHLCSNYSEKTSASSTKLSVQLVGIFLFSLL